MKTETIHQIYTGIILGLIVIITFLFLSIHDYRNKCNQIINDYEKVLDKVYNDNPEYFVDVLMESDEYDNIIKYE